MQKKNLPTNEVPTTTEENLMLAKSEETFQKACLRFRKLQYANGRGTGESQFEELAQHFTEKEIFSR